MCALAGCLIGCLHRVITPIQYMVKAYSSFLSIKLVTMVGQCSLARDIGDTNKRGGKISHLCRRNFKKDII